MDSQRVAGHGRLFSHLLRMFKDGEEVSDYDGNRSSESLVSFAKDHEHPGCISRANLAAALALAHAQGQCSPCNAEEAAHTVHAGFLLPDDASTSSQEGGRALDALPLAMSRFGSAQVLVVDPGV